MSTQDLSTLKAGDALPTLTTGPITPLTLALFAGGSGDHNPIHVDKAFAVSAGFPDVFAHGMLSMAYLGRALTDWAGATAVRQFGVRFAAITPLGASVACDGIVEQIIEQEGERLAKLTLRATVVDGPVTLVGDALVRIG
ncbi:MaoC/PaaZ C-terminal domain-containing protein [Caulobacter sp. BK020]|uniref:MaoC/PaaZ C-terminal domain-containing protein n=1 Tax=Caulobacter sp. BK020 TaxID=2512117 RepID=UPI0010525651|nr:MaoC/PaaZ C-terminal domain-containing protein [Caulobacter sp. BK020]TCS08126.1 acyl dehydratase [Caulobacter sp. BK020]